MSRILFLHWKAHFPFPVSEYRSLLRGGNCQSAIVTVLMCHKSGSMTSWAAQQPRETEVVIFTFHRRSS
ncbi:hypothetical protein PILCRDRAFT_474443 [Piloderma croceum F 1598]|uniref:Uncharacterized protein n=1 Tax=Piloderma croceum (strain F 1598) TaxID=765440 RepID=A0A0C3BY30_PILCF|nr:hypothetical protein PILCRDRAFT_474443 [Piloderma croceum F 1598]